MDYSNAIVYDVEDLSHFLQGSSEMDQPPLFDLENANGTFDIDNFDDAAVNFDAYGEEEPDYTLAAFRILIFIIGILGNLLVIFVILILAEYRKAVTHWYVLQLAIADSLFLLTLPLRAAESLQKGWNYEPWTCKLKETVMFLNYYSSICFLVVMSLDRYIAVCHWRPTSVLQKLRTPLAAMIITVCVWLACFVMCIPVMLYSTSKGTKPNCKCQYEFPTNRNATQSCLGEKLTHGTKEFDDCVNNRTFDFSEGFCIDPIVAKINFTMEDIRVLQSFDSTTSSPGSGEAVAGNLETECTYFGYASGFIGFLWFNFIVMFIIPLIVMTMCYVMIVVRLNATRVRSESCGGSQSSNVGRPPSTSSTGRRKRKTSSSKSSRNRIRVTIMCACMVILFVICWLPFHGVHLAKMKGIYGKTGAYCDQLSVIVSLIAFANSMLNPIIYNFVGTRFVRRIKSVRETRSVKAFFHAASGITGAAARHNSTSGNEQNHDKSTQKHRWRSEAIGKEDHHTMLHSTTVHCKNNDDKEESYVALMKDYPVYIGPTAPPPPPSESLSRSEPPPYQEPSTSSTGSRSLTTEQITAITEQ